MTAIVMTPAELRAWRQRLLDQVPHLSRAQLYEYGRTWQLRPDERAVYATVETIDWLLHDEPPA